MLLYMTPAFKAYIFILTFVLGTVLGSFTNCMAWRIAHNEDFVHGHSHCTACGHQLGARDLVPVFSWLFQKGKCRYCGEKISVRYPLTELITGIAFVLVLFRYDISLSTLQYLILVIILLAISLIDLDIAIIPDRFILAGIINYVVFAVLGGGNIIKNILTGVFNGIVIAVPLIIIVLIMDKVLKKESMGGGDIKLFFMVSMYFNWKYSLFMVLLSCIIGIVFTLIFSNIKANDEDNPMAFPFGPSIAASAVISLIVAEPIINLYLGLFF